MITTGEGGAIVTNNKDLYKKNNGRLKWLSHHAITLVVTGTSLPSKYPNIASNLLNMEITIPVINAYWFIKYYFYLFLF